MLQTLGIFINKEKSKRNLTIKIQLFQLHRKII